MAYRSTPPENRTIVSGFWSDLLDLFHSAFKDNANENVSLRVHSTAYDKLVDVDNQNKYTYIGEALPGTSKSEAKWRIKRLDETDSHDKEIIWANGSSDFSLVWDDRTTYSY